jgi:hypothetical protein
VCDHEKFSKEHLLTCYPRTTTYLVAMVALFVILQMLDLLGVVDV